MDIEKILNKRSNAVVTDGGGVETPVKPTSSQLDNGEIAVNYHKGTERLFIKNDNEEVVEFVSKDEVDKKLDIDSTGPTSNTNGSTVISTSENGHKVSYNDDEIENQGYTIRFKKGNTPNLFLGAGDVSSDHLSVHRKQQSGISAFTKALAYVDDIPSVTPQVQSDWNETNTTSKAYILNKPTIPTKTSDLNNDSKFVSENALTNKQDVLTVPYVADVNFSASVNAYYNLLNFNHLTNASIELPQNAEVNTDVIIFLLKIGTPELGETLNINFYCNGYSTIFPAGFYFEPGSDYEIEFRRTGTYEWTPVKIHNLTNDSTKTRIIIHTKEETTIASLTPNVLHKWGTIDSLTISAFDTPSEVTLSYKEFINEYMIEFTSGSTATTLSLPSSIVWAETPNIEANATYQISVINNLGIIVKFS